MPKVEELADVDDRIMLHDVTWEGFETILAIRGDRGGVRLKYLEGDLELMSPSRSHEGWKTVIARLLEVWAEERDVALNGFGAWTVKDELRKRGAEPDECYSIGAGHDDRPDIAIEVVWTSGGVDKLELYRGLGVPEVWIWQDAALRVFVLADGNYAERAASAILPALDLGELLQFADPTDQTGSARRYRGWLQRDRQPER